MKRLLYFLFIASLLTACGGKSSSDESESRSAELNIETAFTSAPAIIDTPDSTPATTPTIIPTPLPTNTPTPTPLPILAVSESTTWLYGSSDDCDALKQSRREIEIGTELQITGKNQTCPGAGPLAEIYTPKDLGTAQDTIWIVAALLVDPEQVPTRTPTPTPTPTPTSAPTSTRPPSTSTPTQSPATIAPTQPPAPTAAPTQAPPTAAPTQPPPTAAPTEPPPPAPANVVISYILYDGAVARVESDEYAQVTNNGGSAVNLSGWRLNAGNPGQDFWFPGFDLQPGQSCRMYTNEVHPDTCGFSFGSGQALWNNSGDCGYLFNAQGEQVSQYCY